MGRSKALLGAFYILKTICHTVKRMLLAATGLDMACSFENIKDLHLSWRMMSVGGDLYVEIRIQNL